MRITALVISALLMVSNVFADGTLNVKALTKALATAHHHHGSDKGDLVMVYGGQDISRGNVRVMNTIDRTVLAG